LNLILSEVQKQLSRFRCGFRTVSITHLNELQSAIARLVSQGLVSKRLSDTWRFYTESNTDFPEAQTIIIIAIPQPIVRIVFQWQGAERLAEIAPGYFYRADEIRAEDILKNTLSASGYKVMKAHLALKTLAVRSGLAEYGKNNIVYVPRMGSFLRLVAFYTDCPCEEDSWGGYRVMAGCSDCLLCRNNCPTGSISAERFLIYAETCIGFLSQKQPDFPYWVRLQPEWSGGLVGCMRCQLVCPVNKPYIDNIRKGPIFSEEETDLIWNETPLDRLPRETREKLSDMSEAIYPLFSRNLREFVDQLP
jgi:epoxyqueuosine reductase